MTNAEAAVTLNLNPTGVLKTIDPSIFPPSSLGGHRRIICGMCDKMQFSEYLIFKQHIKQIKEMTLLDMAGAEG